MKLVDAELAESPKHLVALEIVNDEDGEVVRRFGVSGLTPRQIDRLYEGALAKVDLTRFHIREVHD